MDDIKIDDEKLVTILEHSQDAIFVKDTEGCYTFINPAGARFMGREVSDIIGKTDYDLFDAETAKIILAIDQKVMETSEPYSEEKCFGEEGFERWFHATISPTFSPEGQLTGTIGISRDMTKYKDLEESLREREEELATIFRCSLDAIFAKDRKGRYSFINPAGAKFMGRDAEDIVGKSDDQLFGVEAANEILAMDRNVIRTKIFKKHETHFGEGDDELWFDVTISPAFSVDGQVTGTIGISRDITKQKRLEELLREKEEKLFTILKCSHDAIFAKDLEGRYTFINPAGAKFLGRTLNDIMGKDDSALFDEETAKEIMATDQQVLETKEAQTTEKCLGEEGHERWFLATVSPSFNAAGQLAGTIGVSRDLTDYRKTLEELWEVEARYHELYDDTPAMFLTLDVEGKIMEANEYGAQHLGYSVEELKNMFIFDLMPSEDRREFKQALKTVIQTPGKLFTTERRFVKKDGSVIWVKDFTRVVIGKDGKVIIPMVTEDITEAHGLYEELSYREKHDGLTGLASRNEFLRQLQRSLFTAREMTMGHIICLFEIDQFKVINETCGQIAGDELLKQISDLLKDVMKERDLLAMLGNDFGILMEKCTVDQAMPKIMTLFDAIKNYVFKWENNIFHLTTSMGVVPVNETCESQTAVLNMADQAISTAKELGGNRVYEYDPTDTDLERRRKEMEGVSLIHKALDENWFQLYYQPIVPVSGTNSHTHYELLIRMNDDKGNIISPDAFLPSAERYNLSNKIDGWVIQTAFSWLDSHPDAVEKLAFCSINLSGQTIGDDEMLDYIITQLDKYDFSNEKICFEITETAAVSNLAKATIFIGSLKELGCRFALDDFGSGMSSFIYLRNLSVDYLKIDGAFVKKIASDEINYAMVKSIHDVGHVMGLKTIAEYVEDDAILSKLREIGVDFAQGYGIAKPQPLDTMAS